MNNSKEKCGLIISLIIIILFICGGLYYRMYDSNKSLLNQKEKIALSIVPATVKVPKNTKSNSLYSSDVFSIKDKKDKKVNVIVSSYSFPVMQNDKKDGYTIYNTGNMFLREKMYVLQKKLNESVEPTTSVVYGKQKLRNGKTAYAEVGTIPSKTPQNYASYRILLTKDTQVKIITEVTTYSDNYDKDALLKISKELVETIRYTNN